MWHLFLLQVLESPFVVAGDITLHDLKNAIAICTLKYRNSQVCRPIFPLALRLKTLQKRVNQFVEYLGDYIERPEYTIVPWDIKGPPPRLGLPTTDAPAIIVVVFEAAHALQMPVKEVWDMPIGEVYVAQAMYQRLQGNRLNFVDDDQRKFEADLKAAQKDKKEAA